MNTAARKTRGSRKAYVLGASTVIALLASTACGPNPAQGPEDRTPSVRPSTSGSATPGPGTGNTGGSGDPVVACAEGDLSFTATNHDEAGVKYAKHLLLTVTNTGSKKCTIHHYPVVMLGADSQAPTPVIKESDPKAPATIAPGEKAYAALLVRGGHRDEYDAKTITLRLQGPKPGSVSAKSNKVDLTGLATLLADDGQLVTYWRTASDTALDFIMSS
ncbi:DUF4232 domain-containing protein [Streptomyces sp. NPDC054956]